MITRQGGISTRCYVERSFVKFHIVSVRCFQAFQNSLNLQKNRRRKCKMLSVHLKPHTSQCLQVFPSQGFLCIVDGKLVLKESLSKRWQTSLRVEIRQRKISGKNFCQCIWPICFDEVLTLETSSLETLCGGQFTLSTQLIIRNYLKRTLLK